MSTANFYFKFLLSHGWVQENYLSFKHQRYPDYEIFFDTSNQIEILKNNQKIDELYIESNEKFTEFIEHFFPLSID